MEIQHLSTYLIAITLLTLTPGIDTLLIIRNSARGGWRDGTVSSLGICSGLFVHAVISAVGISVILLHTAWAFGLLKLMGAGYLIWLGISNWRGVFKNTTLLEKAAPGSRQGRFELARSFREGFLSNVLNPKTIVFYMAFLPQFIDPAGSALIQSLFLAALHFVIAMVWQTLLALTVNQARLWIQRPRVSQVFGGLTGSVMIWLGVQLALKK